ncbi:MAG: tRNA-dihydrouridine synthase family protein [Actinobacteria bacterium]|nr:tRNA-dihydrouridine synthase family protein [Actinomycetota bacterium]
MAPPPSETPEPGRSPTAPSAGVSDPFSEPLCIGALALDRRLFMAPMAGITTLAFRRSVRRWGAGLAFTEMISAYGVHYRDRRTLDYLMCGPDEHPLGFQLFGADADVLADAAARCVEAGADLVDLNMACPMRKVVKTGAGAALLGDPERAAAIVAAVVGAVEGRAPVTVKIRSGLREGDEAGRRTAPRLVAAGAAAVCIHPRTARQLYRGRADHSITFALAAELPVPVIASGDVDGRAAALALLEGGAAAVMLARHALGRPWLFAEILDDAQAPPLAERLAEVRRFTDDVMREMEARSVGYLRQFWPRYRRAGTLDKELAHALMLAPDVTAVRELLDR